MLVRENELRLSAEWQARFAAAERRWDKDWLDEAELLQAAVVSELAPLLVAGGGLARGVQALRLRAQRRPDLALYVKMPMLLPLLLLLLLLLLLPTNSPTPPLSDTSATTARGTARRPSARRARTRRSCRRTARRRPSSWTRRRGRSSS